jgi:glyoxylate reductase
MPNTPLVLMTHTLPDDWVSSLSEKCRLITGPADANEMHPSLVDYLGEAEGLFTLLTIKITESILRKAPRLKVISNMAVGVDNIDVAACTKRAIPVGNTPGVLTEGTADLTFALLLAAARRLPEAQRDAIEGRWKTWSPTGWLGMDLYGATLGIVGMGKIGQAVARRAIGFGMRIVYTDPVQRKIPRCNAVTLKELFQVSDFISIHVPLTEETYHLINRTNLGMMKRNAILINTSRGPVVDQEALYEALQNHMIGAAALDVTDPEPLPVNHPLFQCNNCLILPHIGSATYLTRKKMAELACQNLLAGIEGKRLPNCVNPEVYRANNGN